VTDREVPQLPAGFTWGVATAAYQVEGAAAEDGRGESIWDTFCRQPGVIRDGQTGDVAADHYHRWPEDVALMARLGIGTYRFSLAWPRIQPAGSGPVNAPGLDFYDRLTDALLAEGITPMPTLYHWDLPQPLEENGGWMARDTAYRFAEYAAIAAERLADRIPAWITVNEPFIVTAFGYALGSHAPGKTLMLDALATAHHQLLGHGLANSALRAAGVREVAITNNYTPAWPASDSPSDIAATAAYDALHNWTFTDPVLLGSYPVALSAFGVGPDGPDCARDGDLAIISAPVDALGVNYYNPTQISAPATASAGQSAQPEFARADSGLPFQFEPISGYPVTAFGWPVIPAGLTEILTTLAGRYGAKLPPVYITENGCSVADQPDDLGALTTSPGLATWTVISARSPTRLRPASTSAATWCGR
jgi:beta-glucosidase